MKWYTLYKGYLANKEVKEAKFIKERMETTYEKEYPQDPIILLRTIAIKQIEFEKQYAFIKYLNIIFFIVKTKKLTQLRIK